MKAKGRMFSIELERVEFISSFALVPGAAHKRHTAVAEVLRILREPAWKSSWACRLVLGPERLPRHLTRCGCGMSKTPSHHP